MAVRRRKRGGGPTHGHGGRWFAECWWTTDVVPPRVRLVEELAEIGGVEETGLDDLRLDAVVDLYVLFILEQKLPAGSEVVGHGCTERLGVDFGAISLNPVDLTFITPLAEVTQADSQALRLCLKPLQQRNASKCLALGGAIHAAKNGALHNVFVKLKSGR